MSSKYQVALVTTPPGERGVAEFGSCNLPTGETLLGLATWYSGGSFSGHSPLYTFDPSRPQSPWLEMQRLPSHGAHFLDNSCYIRVTCS